jgi:predicted site-specific integrase-resolvase
VNQRTETVSYVKPGVAAKLLGVTPTTVKNWYTKGRIKGRTLPSGHTQVEIRDGTVVTNSERSDGCDGRVG